MFSSPESELYHHHNFATRRDARRMTMRYVEVFYGRCRPHPTNAGLLQATAMANFTTCSVTRR